MIAPLNWGLGHASRILPLVRILQQDGRFRLMIAGNGEAAALLSENFPELEQVSLPFFRVRYWARLPMWLGILLQLPWIAFSLVRENILLEKIIREYGTELVISDNRFALAARNTYSIYLTHQLRIRMPAGLRWMERILQGLHAWFISRYDECWIPDYATGVSLAGELAHGCRLPVPARFIGPLSHLQTVHPTGLPGSGPSDLLVILSGPEPRRTQFESFLLQEIRRWRGNRKVILVRGTDRKPFPETGRKDPGLTVYPVLASAALRNLVDQTGLVLCRSGYSTIMDLVLLQKPAILVPTPGQTEQEYLAARMKELGAFYSMEEKDFDLDAAWEESKKYHPGGFEPVQEPEPDRLLEGFFQSRRSPVISPRPRK